MEFAGATDLIKKSVLDNFSMPTELDLVTVLFTLGLAFVLGLFIYLIYRLTFGGVIFAKSFGTSLVMLAMVTAMVIMPIGTNLFIALGMVGALSIVRFRTAIKDPLDTMFMFWSIAVGIVLGARLYTVAALASAIIGVVLLVWNLFKSKKNFPFMLVLRFEEGCKKEVQALLRKMPPGRLKSKIVSEGTIELTIEMNIRESEAGMIDSFSTIPGVLNASLISYKGDVVS
jgi:uncharacterized membrane protein YhiD involved in acid resistance